MQTKSREDEVMAKYLLGELSAADQEVVEEKFFVDDEWFDRLSVVEMELIDEYVQGRMSTKERSQFERGFLTTPDRIEKVTNARTLMRHVEELKPFPADETEPSTPFWRTLAGYVSFQSPVMQYGMAAAVLLLIVGGAWLVFDSFRWRQQVQEARNQQSTQARELNEKMLQQRTELQQQLDHKESELKQQLAQSQGKDQEIEKLRHEIAGLHRQQENLSSRQPGEEITAFLSAGPLTRGGSPEPINVYLQPNTKRLNLHIQLKPPTASRYNLSLIRAGGKPIKQWFRVRPRQTNSSPNIRITLPTGLLGEGDYLLNTNGVPRGSEVSYPIRVIRK